MDTWLERGCKHVWTEAKKCRIYVSFSFPVNAEEQSGVSDEKGQYLLQQLL